MEKIIVTARLPGRVEEILAGHELVAPRAGEELLAPDRFAAALPDAEAMLTLLSDRVDEAILSRAPRLRIIANYGVGYDNIDLGAATRHRVLVTSTPDVLTDATADLTMALVLAVARRLPEGMALTRSGSWRGWAPQLLLGLDLSGATLGIVGLGRIGEAVWQRARAFGMKLVYSSRGPRDIDGERLTLDELLARSDVVSLHCPLTPATHHLINARTLAEMKPGALLINSARGPIVDEAALIDALERGQLGGAGLDVFEEEPHIPERLARHPRVICLPHIGSAARGARARSADMAAQSIADFLGGRRPAHVVSATTA